MVIVEGAVNSRQEGVGAYNLNMKSDLSRGNMKNNNDSIQEIDPAEEASNLQTKKSVSRL